tara:strand:+ start:283 stop:582 length:300 start_codon:yes stop_codon:yes gene_type:complete
MENSTKPETVIGALIADETLVKELEEARWWVRYYAKQLATVKAKTEALEGAIQLHREYNDLVQVCGECDSEDLVWIGEDAIQTCRECGKLEGKIKTIQG